MDRVPQACGSRALLPLRQLERRLQAGGTRALDQRWVVTVVECSIPLTGGGQAWVYADALERARGRARWLAFIDIDEFLFSPACECLAPALRAYEPHPGVVVNWQVYVRRLRINHYAVKSRQEFAAKVARHRRSRVGSQYFAYHDRNDTHDPILDRYVPRLRHRLQEIR
jgi:hypothetical protein